MASGGSIIPSWFWLKHTMTLSFIVALVGLHHHVTASLGSTHPALASFELYLASVGVYHGFT